MSPTDSEPVISPDKSISEPLAAYIKCVLHNQQWSNRQQVCFSRLKLFYGSLVLCPESIALCGLCG